MSALLNPEQAKYERLWSPEFPQYRVDAPGESHADAFVTLAAPRPHHTIIDFGCGTGRGARRIAELTRAGVTAVDFVDGCMDDDVLVNFKPHDLTQPLAWLDGPADFGYCTDVMEHVPTVDVDAVLTNILRAARRVYFAISTVDDAMGALIGAPLHLTVQPAEWWRERLVALGFTIEHEAANDSACAFYGTAYVRFDDVEHKAKLNVEEARVRANIFANVSLGRREVAPYQDQDTEIMLLCGGPSLNDFADEIVRRNVIDNVPAVTVNGTYNWLIERGGRPGLQCIVDAREFNRRFTEPHDERCQYVVSSQCDPALVASLPQERTLLWHVGGEFVDAVLNEHAQENGINREWYPVPGGTTVAMRALPLLAMLGFRKISVYGLDSCLRSDAHHAYSQPENDGMGIIEITVDGKRFKCHGWMVKQAHEFQAIVRHILTPAQVELEIHGDGLIAAIIEVAAATYQE